MTHPNKVHFLGVLARLDEPSDKSPAGARGHRVILTSKAAREALHTIEGMGICYRSDWRGHQQSSKIGVIESAEIKGREIFVTGYLFGRDVPDVISDLRASADFGMSYEVADAFCPDLRAKFWRLERVTFTGAAILKRDSAAYRMTDFTLLD